ncbi:MAG TPA: WecB/TagA/CpsF family glycosyltransferase [Candidatus Limnocylindrales bacterium]|nr:WecB/TagA/CpsF family glycosyltransferase [Candidatus Limnocylindrales bacterium]
MATATKAAAVPYATRVIVGTRVDAVTSENVAELAFSWADERIGRYVCVCTVHMVMEGYDDPAFQDVVNGADLVTADGVPLVWCLRLLGLRDATRVHGPWLLPFLCEQAARRGVPVGFYGGEDDVMRDLLAELRRRAPGLQIAYSYCPPFRPLTAEEDAAVVADIRSSGARILFVGLGCPRQERWMAQHRSRLDIVMLGVGAAFDFVSGHKREAPMWMQQLGLGWLFRLLCEPRRLWRRYVQHNPRFVALFVRQLMQQRRLHG